MAKKVYQSFNGFGVDIGQQRADELDRKALEHIKRKHNSRVLDLGAGALGQSKRMADERAYVIAVDIDDYSAEIMDYVPSVNFIQSDVRNLARCTNISGITDIVFQRTIHYLSYEEAIRLLKYLVTISTDKLFISVSGISSEIGNHLKCNNQPIEHRQSTLTQMGQTMFGITAPVCLYSESEFRELLEKAGWQVDEIWASAFHNIKAVCSHKP